MHTNSFSGGDLHYLHNTSDFFNLDITFFYDYHKKEDIHLIEHLLLNPHRVLHTSGLTLEEATYSYTKLNGFTSGIFLSLSMSAHKDDALYLTQTLLELLETPLVITKDMVDKEKNILDAESKYNGGLDLFDIEYFRKYYDFVELPFYNKPLLKRIRQTYDEVIVQNRPYVLIRGNMEDPTIYKSLDLVGDYLSASVKAKSMSLDYSLHKYSGVLEHSSCGEDDSARTLILFNTFCIKNIHQFALQVLLIFLVSDSLFYHIRFQEGTNYDIFKMYRTVYYGWELYFQVFTKLDTDVLMEMIRSVFDYDIDQFQELKLKVYRMVKMRKINPFEEFYFLTQMFVYTGYGISLDDLAHKILTIEYSDFLSYYHTQRVDGLTLSLLPFDEKIPNEQSI